MAREHGNALLFIAGVLLAVGAGAVIFLLAPVLGVGRSPMPRSVRVQYRDSSYAMRSRLVEFMWRRPGVVWGAYAVAVGLAAGVVIALHS